MSKQLSTEQRSIVQLKLVKMDGEMRGTGKNENKMSSNGAGITISA